MQSGDRAKLVRHWQNWRAVLAEALDGIHDAIEEGNYAQASAIMDEVTMNQAQASLSMRSILIKAGVINDGDDDE